MSRDRDIALVRAGIEAAINECDKYANCCFDNVTLSVQTPIAKEATTHRGLGARNCASYIRALDPAAIAATVPEPEPIVTDEDWKFIALAARCTLRGMDAQGGKFEPWLEDFRRQVAAVLDGTAATVPKPAPDEPVLRMIYAELETTIRQSIRDELSVLRRDAERYGWMRKNWAHIGNTIFFDGFNLGPLATLDEAIDAAIAATVPSNQQLLLF